MGVSSLPRLAGAEVPPPRKTHLEDTDTVPYASAGGSSLFSGTVV